ncbi:MAG TPA: hypothetical protein VH682_21945 [Gemmataceae bacterium]|jgi:hypothetical protein
MSPTAPSIAPAELTEPVLQSLERASHPLTFFQLQRRLPRPYQGRTDEIHQCLRELASQGRIHEFAPYRSKAPRFWTRHPEQHARAVIGEVLTEQAVTQRELFLKLRRPLKGTSDARLRELLAQMLLDGQLRKLPPRLGGRDNLLSTRDLQPRDYLEPVFRTFFDTMREVSKRLESEGVDRETFVREAEVLWRAMPWDRLAEAPAPRRAARRRTETPEQPAPAPEPQPAPFEPSMAATGMRPSAPETQPEASTHQAQEMPHREHGTGNREQ